MRVIEKRVRGKKAFINLDLPEYRRTLQQNPLDLIRRLKEAKRKLVVFLDEVQRVENAGESLKLIYDEFPDVKLLISGSSSLELKVNVLPPLVGRVFLFELLTFDFEEFLMARDPGLWRVFREKHENLMRFIREGGSIEEPSFIRDFLELWKEYVIYGGYPEVIKSPKEEEKRTVLKNVFNLYLEKDIATFFRVGETSKFQDFVKALAFNTSSIISLSSLASDLKLSYRRAEEFLEILRPTSIISWLRPFARNLVTELRKAPKFYFWDLGLRNAALENFSGFDTRTDRGALAENFVFRELVQSTDGRLRYWRTTGGAEIDFVLAKENEVVPIEVKLRGGPPGKGFHSFLKAYRPDRGIIVTLDTFGEQRIAGAKIYRVPVFYF